MSCRPKFISGGMESYIPEKVSLETLEKRIEVNEADYLNEAYNYLKAEKFSETVIVVSNNYDEGIDVITTLEDGYYENNPAAYADDQELTLVKEDSFEKYHKELFDKCEEKIEAGETEGLEEVEKSQYSLNGDMYLAVSIKLTKTMTKDRLDLSIKGYANLSKRMYIHLYRDKDDDYDYSSDDSINDEILKLSKEANASIIKAFMPKKKMEKTEIADIESFRAEFIGQEEVVDEFEKFMNVKILDQIKKSRGIKIDDNKLIFLLIGSPGTGKSKYAEMMAKYAYARGLVKSDKYIAITGARLKGEFQGQTAPKVVKLFEEYDVIFLDEVYSLITGDRDSFGNEAVSELLVQMEKLEAGKMLILAGYGGKDMDDKDNLIKKLFDANPGIKSRISKTIYFKSYSADDMVKICHFMAKKVGLNLSEDIDELLYKYFDSRVDAQDFGNAREARTLMNTVKLIACSRIIKLNYKTITDEELCSVTKEDVEAAIAEAIEANLMREGKVKPKLGFC